MLGMIGRRVLAALVVLLTLSVLIFAATEVLPGDVAEVQLGQYATPESVALLRKELGIDAPPLQRYGRWLAGMVQGDFGRSVTTRGPVSDLLAERLANTARLAGVTALIAVPLAIFLGMLMALRAGSLFDRVVTTVVLALSAIPEFLIATLAVIAFAVHLRWLPAISYVDPSFGTGRLAEAMTLPVVTLVLHVAAQIARMTRATIVNLLHLPFMEMAVLKGVPPLRRMLIHALPNMAGPLANVVALNVAYLVSGVVVVETVFAYPGLARLMIDAVTGRDMPVIQACAMIFSVAYVALILLADLVAVLANPRLRRSTTRAKVEAPAAPVLERRLQDGV
ncbi:ABC transporter permease [Roseomonas sp. ACRSG]|nr:ABC transporter permease [Roseomonas sp. ACRSG]